MRPAEPPFRTFPFYVGLFLVALASLALEVLDTRLLSVLTWYSLAFLVIAMGLFGLTVGSVYVYLRRDDYAPDKLVSQLSRDGLKLALAIPLGYLGLLFVPLRFAPVATTIPLVLAFSAILALPFIPAGIIITACLTRSPLPIGRVYAVDLLGAAVGAFSVVFLLERVDGGSAILAMGGVAALASLCFALSANDRFAIRRAKQALVASLALVAFNLSTDSGLVPLWVKGRAEDRAFIERELWTSHSRVQITKPIQAQPALWGGGHRCRGRFQDVVQRAMIIDGDALTPIYHADDGIQSLRFLECDVTNAAHFIRPKGAVAVIGVGGSRDIQSAYYFGHDRVVGVEVNRRLIETLLGPIGKPTRVTEQEGLELYHDEARSFLARHPERRFQMIQASLIDTWASTGAGALALSENGLYTLEAWRMFLDRLEPGGVLTMSRWTGEAPRLASLAMKALFDRGVTSPRDHVAFLAVDHILTIVVSNEPLSEGDVRTLQSVARTKGFQLVAAPGLPDLDPELTPILDAKSEEALAAVTLTPLLDLRPPTDERPFFFHLLRMRGMFSAFVSQRGGALEGNRVAAMALGLSLLSSLALAAVAILFPLWKRARPTGRSGPMLFTGIAYFALIGTGFMLAEIALLQRLSIVLGHPTYSLVAVLGSMVASAGVGSLLSEKLPLERAPYALVFPLLMAGLVTLVAFLLPIGAAFAQPGSLPVRIGFAVGLTSVLGLALGMAFPAGMRMSRGLLDEEAPWLFGINGVMSVVSSSLAMAVAISFGTYWLLVLSAIAYALLAIPSLRLARAHAEAKRISDSSAIRADAA